MFWNLFWFGLILVLVVTNYISILTMAVHISMDAMEVVQLLVPVLVALVTGVLINNYLCDF